MDSTKRETAVKNFSAELAQVYKPPETTEDVIDEEPMAKRPHLEFWSFIVEQNVHQVAPRQPYETELDNYLKEPVAKKDEDVFIRWKQNG